MWSEELWGVGGRVAAARADWDAAVALDFAGLTVDENSAAAVDVDPRRSGSRTNDGELDVRGTRQPSYYQFMYYFYYVPSSLSGEEGII